LHDAITAEKAGVPAAAIITDRFAETAKMMAQVSGMPDYPFAVIAHPISNNNEAVLKEKAESALRQCVGLLLRQRA
jgi:hypothetical protein